eukprot:TRINITY_DN6901_c0_g1_i6.p1 TRINITY_DN6901_c0_g1~~TRINITY_DN6901_c0_g1_i6.p1  ORF type:complete len:584 (-),score=47.12 TRINITY_DN6901_c0_g1_i6:136-1887(-)
MPGSTKQRCYSEETTSTAATLADIDVESRLIHRCPSDENGKSCCSKPSASSWGCAPRDWLNTLSDHFGHRLLVTLFVVQHVQKGFTSSLLDAARPYLYKSYGTPAPQVQVYNSVVSLPWDMKPMIGLLSDVLPIGGYHKGPYMVGACVFGCMACLLVAFVICSCCTNLHFSTCDLLSEANYAEKIQKSPKHAPALLTYVWFGMTLSGLAASLFSGSLIESVGPRTPYLIAALPIIATLIPVGMGFLEEQKQTGQDVQETRTRYCEQWEVCMLCFLMFGCSVVLFCCGLIFEDPVVNAIVAMIIAAVVLISFSLVLSPLIAKFNAFVLVSNIVCLSTSGASFYFYTDTPAQYPEGPNFQPVFYNTVVGTLGSICSLAGIYFYQRYLSSWKYRDLFLFTQMLASALGSLDVLMFARVNVKLGVPDHLLVLGLSVFEPIVRQWMQMPSIVILSHLCPEGMEATMYALLAGCSNLGGTISSNLGAFLLDRMGCLPAGKIRESAQFENLWVAAAISTVLPLLVQLVSLGLIPDAYQNERLVHDRSDATAGSLLRRWWGHDREGYADATNSQVDSPEHADPEKEGRICS